MTFPDNILEQQDHFVLGTEITSATLVGFNHERWPHPSGNCFSMLTVDGREFRIVNFCYENMQELTGNREISFPIRLYILGDPATSKVAVVYDTRIQATWYAREFCTVCTPKQFLSFTQRMHDELGAGVSRCS